MSTPLFVKKSFYSGLIFFGTLVVLSFWFATYQEINSSEYASGQILTSSLFWKIVTNLADHENRMESLSGKITSLSGSVSTLQSITINNSWNTLSLSDTNPFNPQCDYIANNMRPAYISTTKLVFLTNDFGSDTTAEWYAINSSNKTTMLHHADNWANNAIASNISVSSISYRCP